MSETVANYCVIIISVLLGGSEIFVLFALNPVSTHDRDASAGQWPTYAHSMRSGPKWKLLSTLVVVSLCVWEAERNSNSDSNRATDNRAVTAATITASTALACASVSVSVALLWPRILTVPQAKATQRRPTRALFLLESLGVWENVLCIPGELKKQLKVLSLEVITPKREVLLKNVKKKKKRNNKLKRFVGC